MACSVVNIECKNTGVSASVVKRGGFDVAYTIEQLSRADDLDIEVSSRNDISVGVQVHNIGIKVSVQLVCFVNPDIASGTYLAVKEGFVKTSDEEFIIVLL